MQGFDDMFKNFFEQSKFPNPFDPEGISRFVQEQIKNSMPDNWETMSRSGQNPFQNGNTNSTNQETPNNNPWNSGRTQPNYTPSQSGAGQGASPSFGRSTGQQNQASQQNQGHSTNQSPVLKHQAFETHDDIIIRVQIPEDLTFRPEKLFLTTHQLSFNNEEHKQPLLQINLPKAIEPKRTKAGFRQGILEIKLAKKIDEPVTEINMTDLFKPSEET